MFWGAVVVQFSVSITQRVLSTHMGNTYPNHKGNDNYINHTLYHIGTLDPLGYIADSTMTVTFSPHVRRSDLAKPCDYTHSQS